MTDLIFCEKASDLAWAKDLFRQSPAGRSIVALTPEVAWTCQQQQWPYLKLDQFITQAELFSHRPEVFRQTYEWITWLDGYLERSIPSLGGKGFAAATAHSFIFQLLFDEFFAEAYALKALFQKHPKAQVWYRRYETPSHLDMLSGKISLVPYLLPEIGKPFGITLSPVASAEPGSAVRAPHVRLKSSLMNGLIKMNMMGDVAQIRTYGLKRYVQSRLKQKDHSQDPILVLGCGYDIDFLVMALREQGARVQWIQALDGKGFRPSTDRQMRNALAGQWAHVREEESFWRPLTQWGIGHNEFFASVVRFWWDRELPDQCELYGQAEMLLEKKRFRAVVSWETESGPMTPPFLDAAKKRKIPCVIYQHGSTFRIDGILWYRWLLKSDLFLVYGEGTAKQLRETLPPPAIPHVHIQPVGSARLEAISRLFPKKEEIAALRSALKQSDPRPLILYVPTVFATLVGRAFSDIAGYPDVSYFELQQEVLKVFASFPGVRLLYKDLSTRNSLSNPILDMIRAQCPNVSIVSGHTLTKLFWAADAIIVDHAVTALSEALLTAKPLLVYDPGTIGSIPEPPEARALLRKRAIVSETGEDFLRDIRNFLQKGDFRDQSSPNQECLSRYGTHLNDGRSADRAANSLLSLCSN